MTREQVNWAMTHKWYRDHQEIGSLVCPEYKVWVSDGLIRVFSKYTDLVDWVNKLEKDKEDV